MVSRRQFLKHAVATGVVAAVAPSLLANVPQSLVPKNYHATVELTYRDIVLGHEEPDLICIPDIEHYRRMVQLLQKLNDGLESGRYHWETVSDA